jgi:hypothetical protein
MVDTETYSIPNDTVGAGTDDSQPARRTKKNKNKNKKKLPNPTKKKV